MLINVTTREYSDVTIKLQIILPNRSITQSLRVGAPNKTIYTMITRFLSLYAPEYTEISNRVFNKTYNVKCPELDWQRPTLYEVLNDLLGYVNSIVTVRKNEDGYYIDCIDLDEKGIEINENYINDYEQSQNIEDYASQIEIEVQNAITYKSANTVEGGLIPKNSKHDD